MFRNNPIAIVLFCAVVACSLTAESLASGQSGPTIQTDNQNAPLPGITAEKIVHDVIGSVVKVTDGEGDSPPIDWTFEADEFRHVEILERRATPTAAAITVFMTTRNNPEPDEEAVQVSGKLRLHYQREGGQWVLRTIENLTFCYTIGIST